jgi:NADPH-dependent 2,4-dienoyl-CoA reductase/sulfur reductase-like enzyme
VSLVDRDSAVVIVGAGLAGWRLAEALRHEGFEGRVTIVGDEVHEPYDRPPLSKQVLVGKWDLARTTLVRDDSTVANSVEWRLGRRAVALDVAGKIVTLDDGSRLDATHVAIATGARARRLTLSARDDVHTIRSRDDLAKLLTNLERADATRPWVIIGAGFLGAEVATALRTRDVTTVVLEVANAPLAGVVGPQAAQWLRRLPDDFGVNLRTNQQVRDVRGASGALVVELENGENIDAAGVVACVGSELELGWLRDSGLRIDGGVVVDANLQAANDVAALGDVARFVWPGPTGEELIRVEHWEVANFHAAQLARFWTQGVGPERVLVPYFWSDQYGKKIQMLGHPRPDDEVTLVHGDLASMKWLALYTRHDVVTGLLAVSAPRALMVSKVLLDEVTSRDDAFARAPWNA